MALGVDDLYEAGHSTYSFAPLFGTAAAGALTGISEQEKCWTISYARHQAWGVKCWQRDLDHIES